MTDRINHNVAAAMNALYEHQGDPPEIARLRVDIYELRLRLDDLATQVAALVTKEDTADA